MKTFKTLWQITQDDIGWLFQGEARELYSIAKNIESGSNIVELGAYAGKMSAFFGHVALHMNHDFTAIDNFKYVSDVHKNVKTSIMELFDRVMNKIPTTCTLLAMDFDDASKFYKKKIDLLFIDGDHSFESVQNDFNLWSKKMRSGGIIVFHDYGNIQHPEVKDFVDTIENIKEIKLVESLYICELI